MTDETTPSPDSVRTRLIEAALACFLGDAYHKVTTRQIAARAGVNVSMIRYYFGNKEGLYEEMIRHTLAPLLDVLDDPMPATAEGFGGFLKLYYTTMSRHPEFPRLILKILALNEGPGRRFVQQLLERGRSQTVKTVQGLKAAGHVSPAADPDIIRMAFVSLAITPMLLKDIFEEQLASEMDALYLDKLAGFNAHLFSAGLASLAQA